MNAVLRAAFQMSRKMLRQSLKELLKQQNVVLPDAWGTLRPGIFFILFYFFSRALRHIDA